VTAIPEVGITGTCADVEKTFGTACVEEAFAEVFKCALA